MFKFQKYFLLIIPFLISIIIYSWFNTGQIISNTSEENLNISHSQKSAEYYSTFWYPAGTGFKIAFSISRYPTFAVLGVLEEVGIPTFLRQAFLLAMIMIVGMFSMYLLIKKGFDMENQVAIIGSIFYSLNIYSLTQIWKRFLYNHMIAWAYLPFFILLWIKWISTGKLTWLLYFLLSSLFFTYAFSNPVFLFTFWVPASIFVLNQLWLERKKKREIAKILVSFVVGLILWSAVNIWWLYPTLTLGSSWTQQTGQTWLGDFNSLQAVSKSFSLNEILLLRQSWYLGKDNDWYDFYHNPLIYLISISVLAIAVLGFIKLKGNKYRKYLLALSLVGLFISKGTNFPLGYTFYYFLFGAFPLTAALRNSYEKFGLVWLLPYAIFFAYGLYWLFLKIKNRYKKVFFLALMLFLSCGVLVYPMWNGDIFPPKHRVEVPAYYYQANSFLNSEKVDRAFHIPFDLELEKISYDWGYIGEDPTENLFDHEPLTKPIVPIYDRIYKMLPNYLSNANFPKLLGMLGAEYIIFHKDMIYPRVDLVKTQTQIETWEGASKTKTFGKLDIYSLDLNIVKPKIYASGTLIKRNSIADVLNQVSSDNWNTDSVFTLEDVGFELKNGLVPQISFAKMANDMYRVRIKNNQGSYILVLNNTYDGLWKAKVGGQLITKHFLVNGFANGWLIEKKGNYDIDIRLKIWPWD